MDNSSIGFLNDSVAHGVNAYANTITSKTGMSSGVTPIPEVAMLLHAAHTSKTKLGPME